MPRGGPARSQWLVVAGCAVAAAVLTVLVAVSWAPLQTLDRRIVDAAHRQVLAHDGLLATARLVTHLGDPLVVTGLTVLLSVALLLRGLRLAALAVLVVRPLAALTSTGLKNAVDRPRPALHEAVAHASGSAFPSGHALGSAALWATAAFLLRDLVGRWWALAVATIVPLLVATTRVLLGVHWPSDVVAGLVLGWGVATATLALLPPRPRRVP